MNVTAPAVQIITSLWCAFWVIRSLRDLRGARRQVQNTADELLNLSAAMRKQLAIQEARVARMENLIAKMPAAPVLPAQWMN